MPEKPVRVFIVSDHPPPRWIPCNELQIPYTRFLGNDIAPTRRAGALPVAITISLIIRFYERRVARVVDGAL